MNGDIPGGIAGRLRLQRNQALSSPTHREKGPAKGLFTGSQGEWVILGPEALQNGGEKKNNEGQETGWGPEHKQQPQESPDAEQ